ncbi:LOW QUALITY PROTEIN: E3 ubiquitin-protein ligase RNF125 [Podargus strigoides]
MRMCDLAALVQRFCQSCICKFNAWTCPYHHIYLPSEGVPATDTVCLSEIGAHLRTCEKYIEKYGPLQELGDTVRRWTLVMIEKHY